VRTGVAPGSWFHQTECFGPVLGVMAADDLEQATRWQNRVAFGLTGGIESLDDGEIAWWLDHVEVGNAYVNRPTTGAIVRRQPFGGWKRSVVGPGAKAGGPNYVASLGTWEPSGERAPAEGDALAATAVDYRHWWDTHFAVEHDPSGLASERNRFRYRPLAGPCLLRVEADAAVVDLGRALLAATVTGTELSVSCALPAGPELLARRDVAREVVVEDEAQLAERLASGATGALGKIRLLGTAGDGLRRAARARWLHLDDDRPSPSGRVELGRWLREQTISETRHRYGNPW
jgi:RHH-type proline utilization regulon transcriptional repressor/proline dehydrogenase/delta 1-pyrroline-5-carboxylate dehydrogenase